jgi:hypothetical protein
MPFTPIIQQYHPSQLSHEINATSTALVSPDVIHLGKPDTCALQDSKQIYQKAKV